MSIVSFRNEFVNRNRYKSTKPSFVLFAVGFHEFVGYRTGMIRNRISTLLGNRNFILLFWAYVVSAFGDHLSELAIMKTMGVEQGDEKTRIGAQMLFYFFLPYVLLGPLAGAIADRFPRRIIMILADVARGFIGIGLPWYLLFVHDAHPHWMMMPILGLGFFACFFNPARQSLVPTLVQDAQLTRANSILNGLGPIAAICSYVVGGWLVDQSWNRTLWANFYGDAGTYFFSACCVSLILVSRHPTCSQAVPSSVLTEMRQGLRYIRQHRFVWQLMIFTATFWTAAGVFSSTLPTVVFNWYDIPKDHEYQVLGIFRATVGAGMLLGAIVLTLVADASRGHWNIIVGLLGTGLAVGLFSQTRLPWMGGAFGIMVGMCGAWILISATTLLQRIVPDRSRGRIFGIVDLANMAGMITATGVLGILRIPGLDDVIDWVLLGMGLVMGIMGVLLWRHHLRRSRFGFWVATVRSLNEVWCKFWHRLKRDGVCTVPPTGPCIVTANHLSSADPSFLIASCPNRLFGFMIAQEFYSIPIWKHLIRQLECIPVRRDGTDVAATKQALRQLRDGRALCVFIEGGISTPGNPRQPQDGVALLAMRTGAKVIPAHISGASFREQIFMTYLHRNHVRVQYGPPVDLSEFTDFRDRDQVRLATVKIWNAIENLETGKPETSN